MGHGHFQISFLVPVFSLGGAERMAFLNFLECIKVVKYVVKIMLENAL